ncbi:MAG TPA: uroporphyrinogen-III synthase [Terriglobales bacterium]|nr:uroporphyrinogen-III synthase [Terriglobales bacterium]
MAEQPLAHRRIVVTRAAGQARELLERLRRLGAEAFALPLLAIAPPADPQPLAAALGALDSFDGIVFSSANAVAAVRQQLRPGPRPRAWVCAAGAATATAVREQLGWEVAMVPMAPEEYGAVGVVRVLAEVALEGRRILFPRAAAAREVIVAELTRRGACVTSVEAYRSEIPAEAAAALRGALPGAAAVVFTSPSTVRHLAALAGAEVGARLAGAALFAIGPTTRTALEEQGWPVAATAPQASTEGLVTALTEYFRA